MNRASPIQENLKLVLHFKSYSISSTKLVLKPRRVDLKKKEKKPSEKSSEPIVFFFLYFLVLLVTKREKNNIPEKNLFVIFDRKIRQISSKKFSQDKLNADKISQNMTNFLQKLFTNYSFFVCVWLNLLLNPWFQDIMYRPGRFSMTLFPISPIFNQIIDLKSQKTDFRFSSSFLPRTKTLSLMVTSKGYS